MGAVDPTYPLYPIATLLAAAMLLLILLSSFVRQSWNLGVAFLCFWLFLENFTDGMNAIIWSDNAVVKFYVYCDIVSHVQLITYVVKPMSSLIITRRLHLIASLESVDIPGHASRRRNSVLEWTLGLIIPLLVTGPIYYVHQSVRFVIHEVSGCQNAPTISILEILTIDMWTIVIPLISIIFYYPRVVLIFYRQNRDINSFLRTNTSVSRTNYIRILALASIDILLTMPVGIAALVLEIISSLPELSGSLPFYWGWQPLHTLWEPVSVDYADIERFGASALARSYFNLWLSPVLAFAIFGLFGLTEEARASYWRIICSIEEWIGWRPRAPIARKERASLGEIEFSARPQGQDVSLGDIEMGLSTSRRPSFVTPEALDGAQGRERTEDRDTMHKSEDGSISEMRGSTGKVE